MYNIIHIKWEYFDRDADPSSEERWIAGNEGETIKTDKIIDWNISPISSVDDNFNIREPRTADFSIVYDTSDEKIMSFIEKLKEADEFKKQKETEIDEDISIKDEERLDVVKIRITVFDDSSYPIFYGFVEKTSISINEKTMTLNFSAIDPLYLYKTVIEDGHIETFPVYEGTPIERYLTFSEIMKMLLLQKSWNLDFSFLPEYLPPREIVFPKGWFDQPLIDVSDIRREIDVDLSFDDPYGFPAKNYTTNEYSYIKISAAYYMGASQDSIFVDFDFRSPQMFERRSSHASFEGCFLSHLQVTIPGKIDMRGGTNKNHAYSMEQQIYFGFTQSYQGQEGLYFWGWRNMKFKIPHRNINGNAKKSTITIQEYYRFKVINQMIHVLDGSDIRIRSLTEDGWPSNINDYPVLNYTAFGFQNLQQVVVHSGQILKEHRLLTVSSDELHSTGVPLTIRNRVLYTGPVYIEEYDFGGETFPAIDILKFMLFTSGSYIFCNPKTKKITIKNRLKTLLGDENYVSLDKPDDDDLIIESVTEKVYHETYNSEGIMKIFYNVNIALINLYNKLYELVFNRNIISENVKIHTSAEVQIGAITKKVINAVDIETILKYKNRLYRVMSVQFESDNTRQYNLWHVGKVTTPSFSHEPGEFAPFYLEIYCILANVTIRYTADGSNPNEDSSIYTSPIFLNVSKTIKAIAYHNTNFFEPSMIKRGQFNII